MNWPLQHAVRTGRPEPLRVGWAKRLAGPSSVLATGQQAAVEMIVGTGSESTTTNMTNAWLAAVSQRMGGATASGTLKSIA